MVTSITDVTGIRHNQLDSTAFIKWVLPTVALEPFCTAAGLTVDDVLFKNKPNLSAGACQRLTELLWPGFSASLRKGREVEAEEAKTHLVAKDHAYVRSQYPHVVFKHADNVFVAEYELISAAAEVLRCWKAPSAEIHPATVFVTFKDVAEKERFDRIAADLGYGSDELLLSLARDFSEKLSRRSNAITAGQVPLKQS